MPDDYPVEDIDVGAALAEHRENLGVTYGRLVLSWVDDMPHTVGQIEHTRRPHRYDLEAYHKALMAAWAATSPRAQIGRSLREQWLATPADWKLWDAAKRVRPAVVWWWGARSDLKPNGAYCYICERHIWGFNVQQGLSRPARRAVMAHRYDHLAQLAAGDAEPIKEPAL